MDGGRGGAGQAASVVIGVSQANLNALSASLFAQSAGVDPGFFQGDVAVGSLGVKAAHWAIEAAPQVSVQPPAAEREWLRAHVEARLDGHPRAAVLARHLAEDTVVVMVTAPSTVTLSLDDGSTLPLPGTSTTFLQARTAPGPQVVVQAQGSKFVPSGPVQPGLQWVLDHVVVPELQRLVNEWYASGFAFDLFDNDVVALAPPSVCVDGQWLLAYSGPGATVPAPPPAGSSWPGPGFAMLTRSFWSDVLGRYLEKQHTGASGKASFGVNLGLFKVKVSAQYAVGLTEVGLGAATSSTIDASATVGGSGSVCVDVPLIPDIHLGLEIAAAPEFTLTLERRDQLLRLEPTALKDTHVKLRLTGVPKVISDIVGKIIDGLLAPIRPLVELVVKKAFAGPSMTLPSWLIPEGDVQSTFSVGGVEITSSADRDAIQWLGLSGTLEVTTKSSRENAS